ncbi:MAG: host attachment family protein [Sphingorhabdus sp.]
MTLPHNALVLVADGRKMLFLRNFGHGLVLDLRTEAHHARDDLKDHEIKSDAPGLGTQSGGFGRPAMDETDFHQQDEDRYAADAAEQLQTRALAGDYDALAIIAPPKTLGNLRKHFHKEVERRIVMELPKEMTDRPIPDIAAMLMIRSEPPN